jgi:6-phosphofructokinase 1
MGRDAGFIALQAGIAGDADAILIPEIPYDVDVVCAKIRERVADHRLFSLVAVSEGARPVNGEQTFRAAGDAVVAARLGGVGFQVGAAIERCSGRETRVTVLGHLQRGGSPSPYDRWLATRFGAAAVRLAAAEGWGRMVGVRGPDIVDSPLAEATATPKRVNPRGEPVQTARGLGIVFG